MTYALIPTGLLALALKGARTAFAVVKPATVRIADALRNRLAVQRLRDLDDRALKDIGLVRSDVAGALAAPLHVDPSSVLSDRRLAHERRLLQTVLTTRPDPARPGHLPRPAA